MFVYSEWQFYFDFKSETNENKQIIRLRTFAKSSDFGRHYAFWIEISKNVRLNQTSQWKLLKSATFDEKYCNLMPKVKKMEFEEWYVYVQC